MNPWDSWFESLNLETRNALINYVNSKSETEVTLTREKTEDLYVVNPPVYVDVHELFPLYDHLAFGPNMLLKGPKGDGKTLSILSYAHSKDIPVVTIECSESTRESALIGNFFLKGKETAFVLGKMPTAIDVANEVGKCILVFEEFNALTPQVQKSVNALLDFRKFVTIPQIGKTYRLEEGCKLWIVATMNPSVYGGTYDLNEDLKSRLEEVEVGYPPPALEKTLIKEVTNTKISQELIDRVVMLATETRQPGLTYSLSPRDVIRLVNSMELFGAASSDPATVDAALNVALQLVICKFEDSDRETIKKRVESIFKGVNVNTKWRGI